MTLTLKDLEVHINRMNIISGSPENVRMVGNYHLSRAYGGYDVHRTMNESGGIKTVFGYHMPKKLLLVCINSWLEGYYAAKTNKENAQ